MAVLKETPNSYAESFRLAARAGLIGSELADGLAPFAGTRNILVRDYLEVDYELIAAAIPPAIEQY